MVYAIMATRSVDLNWEMRAVRVLPIFLIPALSSVMYSTYVRFTRMRKYLKLYTPNTVICFYYSTANFV